MEFKLKSGKKVKLKEVTLDERDAMLDGVEYEMTPDGEPSGMKMMHSTITKWLRLGLEGDTSDDVLKEFSFNDRTEIFLKMQTKLLVGEENASD